MLLVQAAAAPPTSAAEQTAPKPSFQMQTIPSSDGRVVLRCAVTSEGALQACKVLSETPAGHHLAEAAFQTAAHLHVQPKLQNGRPVAGYMTLPLKFVLTD